MYAQVEKPKENNSRAVANSVTQKKSNIKQSFEFVDNRSKANINNILQLNSMNNKGRGVIQRAIGKKGLAAIGKGVAVEGQNIQKFIVKNAEQQENGKWKYFLIFSAFPVDKGWVNEDEKYDLIETEIKKEPKEGQKKVTSSELKAAVKSPGTLIGETQYKFKIEDKKIELNHNQVPDLKCYLQFELDGKQQQGMGVKNCIARPYDRNGLGTLLVGAFYIKAREAEKSYLTLTTDNTAPAFWGRFGLQQNAETILDDARLMVSETMIVSDPPIKQG